MTTPTNDLFNQIYHEVWNVIDSTKLTKYMDCPRSFFYEYILGWRINKTNNHLVFGSAWHEAMEHLAKTDYSQKNLTEAFSQFMKCYRKELPPETDEDVGAKTPTNAGKALFLYAAEYPLDPVQYKTLHTEVSGTVEVNDAGDLFYFKQDTIMEDLEDNKVFSLEHKTGSSLTRTWTDQWKMAFQVSLYHHALYSFFPPDKVKGVVINGTFFQKRAIKFHRVPVYKKFPEMQDWHLDFLHWYEALKKDLISMQANFKTHLDEQWLTCFRRNPNSCTKYFGCPYLDFCSAWTNPLQNSEEPPIGFTVFRWDPREHQTEDTRQLKL